MGYTKWLLTPKKAEKQGFECTVEISAQKQCKNTPHLPYRFDIELFQFLTLAATPGVPKMAPDPPKKVKIAILTPWVILNSPKDHTQEIWSKSVKWC